MTMVPNFTIIFIFIMFTFKFVFTNKTNFFILICCSFLNNFIFSFKLIIYIACYLNHSQTFYMQSLHLYTSRLFSMLLNDDIVDIGKPDEICSHASVVDEFPRLSLHSSVFSIKHSSSA